MQAQCIKSSFTSEFLMRQKLATSIKGTKHDTAFKVIDRIDRLILH